MGRGDIFLVAQASSLWAYGKGYRFHRPEAGATH
jgi:hypothetical protein